ncbi:MAG: hypothetical protein ACWA5U_11400 [bacterium]
MALNNQQIQKIHDCLTELAEQARNQSTVTKKNIYRTNWIIIVFTSVGALFAIAIFYYFVQLTYGVKHSVNSLQVLEAQMTDMRGSMDEIAFSVDNMGLNISYIGLINDNIKTISQHTQQMNQEVALLKQNTQHLGIQSRLIHHHTQIIDQSFFNVNHTVKQMSHSIHHVAKPIDRFFPIP